MEEAASKIFLGHSWHVPAARPCAELVIYSHSGHERFMSSRRW